MGFEFIDDDAALALAGTADARLGIDYPALLQANWGAEIIRALYTFGRVGMTSLGVVPIAGNADAVGVLPGGCTISGVILEYAGSAGAAVIDGLTNNDTTYVWAYNNSGVIGFGSAVDGTGWPGGAHYKLAKVVMSEGVIQDVVDMRWAQAMSV